MGVTLLDLTEVPKTLESEALTAEILRYLAANKIKPTQVAISCEINSEISIQDLKAIRLRCGLTESLVSWRRPLRRSIIRKSPEIADGLLELSGIPIGAKKIVKVLCSKTSSKLDFVEVIPRTRNMLLEEALYEIPSLRPNLFRSGDFMELSRSISMSWPANRLPRVFVDVSSIIKNDLGTGIQRVIRNLIPELIHSLPESYDFALVAADENGGPFHYVDFSKGQKSDEMTLKRVGEIVEFIRSDIFLGLDLNYGVTISHSNYFSTLQRRGVKLVALVYDLLPIQFPHYFPQEVGKLKLHERYIEVVSTFDVAIAISNAVEDDYIEWVRKYSPKRLIHQQTGFIPLGSGLKKNSKAKTVDGYGDFFLHVGTVEPRKNVLQILDAFEILWQQDSKLNLVLVGKEGWGMDQGIARLRSHPEIGKRLHWLETLEDAELSILYSKAICLIMASSGEGYGLPIIEAHSFGTRVLARKIPVFEEVCIETDSLFEGNSPEDLSAAIMALENLGKPSRDLPAPSWQESAAALVKLIEIGE